MRWALESHAATITFKTVSHSRTHDIDVLLDEAAQDPRLGPIVHERATKSLVVFYHDQEAVGFAIPRQEGSYWRTGPIYVTPAYRNQGIAGQFVLDFFKNKKGRSYIAQDNHASQTIFIHAGFVKTHKFQVVDHETVYLYVKE